MWSAYYTPATLDEALTLLAEHGGAARVIAGGTDIIIELERGMRPGVEALIDISRIPGLDEIRSDDDGRIHIGPLVTHNHVVASPMIVQRGLPLAQACWEVGSPQIRNRGTLSGNLITASPANDTITPLWAMDARVRLRSTRGERELAFDEFFEGVRRTAMQPDELLTEISFTPLEGHQRGKFIKFGLRRAQAISVANVAAVLSFDGPIVIEARIALGSVAPTIVRCAEAEDYLVDRTLDEAEIDHAADLAAGAASPIDDIRGSAAYRIEIVKVIMRRALRAIHDKTMREGYPVDPVMLWGPRQGRVAGGLDGGFVHRADDPIETLINGQPMTVRGAIRKTLLRMLREDVGLTGTKEGCAEGECGACTVFLDGMAVMACMVAAPRAHRAEIVTLEGLAREDRLHPIQQAFVDEGAVQCGYCTPGVLMVGAKLLEERPHPSLWEIQQSMTGNLCRCTGYYKIFSAFEKAARYVGEDNG
jgi:xanthine dehydrogenase iron-sulfur cluster and FAD-binding subunit A